MHLFSSSSLCRSETALLQTFVNVASTESEHVLPFFIACKNIRPTAHLKGTKPLGADAHKSPQVRDPPAKLVLSKSQRT
ncbi:hypothetical protein TNCV_1269551 [Trichonephila clavipes]|nr:hypothetical protein TNCV_1269551 [Trichonephila clavipes]